MSKKTALEEIEKEAYLANALSKTEHLVVGKCRKQVLAGANVGIPSDGEMRKYIIRIAFAEFVWWGFGGPTIGEWARNRPGERNIISAGGSQRDRLIRGLRRVRGRSRFAEGANFAKRRK